MGFIGIGKLSKYHIYIIVSIVCQFISDYSMGLNKMMKPDAPKIFQYFAALNHHLLVQNAILFLGILIGGIILYIFSKICISNKKRAFTMADAQKKREEILGGKCIESNYVGLFLVSIFIALSTIQNSLPNQLHLENYFWMLELIILLILSHLILKTKIGNHHTLAIFVTLPLLIFEFIGFCLPFTKHECGNMTLKECKEKYITDNNFFLFLWIKYGKLIYIFGALFIIVIILRDYSWIKSKYLMDIRGIHPSIILMFTGIIGLIFVFILLFFATLFPCNTIDNVANILKDNRNVYLINGTEIDLARQICLITKYDNDTKQLHFYYDNFISFINEYNENNANSIINNESTIKIELLLVIPIYFIMNLVINISNIMIIRYLDPNIILLISNVVYFSEETIFYFIIIQGDYAYKTSIQFIFTELKQIFSLIGNIIYIELIELRFCKLDYDLRKNIKSRGERESILGPLYEGEEENENERDKNKYDLGLNDSLTED